MEFEELLTRVEGQTIDFKQEAYTLKTDHGRGSFIKDVLSMANTPREDAAYIVVGVKAHSDGKKDLIGLTQSVDDADYQSSIKSKVHPSPTFLYIPVQHHGKTFGVFEIPPERKGPCQATMDVGVVRRYVTYFRRGTQNDEARPDEQQSIRNWCDGHVQAPIEMPKNPITPWEQFLVGLHGFEPSRLYILIVGPTHSGQKLAGLATAPWNFVFDFDPNNANADSLAQAMQPDLRKRRAVHEVMIGDRPTIHVERTSYWYYANGSMNRRDTVVEGSWAQWRKKYGRDISGQMEAFAAGRNSRPVTVLSLWDSEDHVESVFSEVLAVFGDAADFIVAHPSANSHARLSSRFGAALTQIDLIHLAEGLASLHRGAASADEGIRLPTKSGTTVTVASEDVRYIEEELEIVGMSAGTVAEQARDMCVAFYRGKQITWFELGLNCEVERDKTSRVLKSVQYDLGGSDDKKSKGTTRINLYHAPGAGGTTIGRSVAWKLHLDFPTLVLKKSMPVETTSRIERIYKLTGLPILVLVEGADIAESQIDELYSMLRARQVSVVFLQILRRFSPAIERERSFYQESLLSAPEATRFAHKLAAAKPERRNRLLKLSSTGMPDERSAFYFALEAFEEDFEGLSHYVRTRLAEATPDQTAILVFLSIAYHYGHQSLPGAAFAAILGLPKTQRVNLDQILPAHLRDLLRRGSNDLWRTAHDLIAIEILRQALAPNATDNRVWKQNLSTWAIRFADFCSGDDPVASDDMMEIASRCFVFRDDADPLGGEVPEGGGSRGFSHLIQDIPSQEGRLVVLKALTERFPEEAHFWGHLGRFYSLELNDYQNSLDALDKAIELSPDDGVLYHMKGMALRSKLYDAMQSGRETSVREAVELAEKAADQFTAAVAKDPYDEHGYISHVQMLLRLVDFATRKGGDATFARTVVNAQTNPAIRESLDIAEELLQQAARLRQGERPSAHVERCRVQLDALYGAGADVMLQGWDNLLTRTDVYRPPIRRQLVHTYLSRRERRWEGLADRELNRITDLLEQNLLEEPNDPRNIRLWLQAVRRKRPPISIDAAIEKVTYWKINSNEIDPVYYLYILHALKAIDASPLAFDAFKENLDECRRRARTRPNRTGSFEWLGPGEGLPSLINFSELGEWNKETDFWRGGGRLTRPNGRIVSIAGPEAGLIELAGGIRAFFVPGRSSHLKGRDENRAVQCFLGFSYDGPRAWEVSSV